MHEGEGVLGVAGFTRFLVNGLRRHAHQAHLERGLSFDAHAVAFLARYGIDAGHRHLVVFIVGHAHHGGHGDGEVPVVAVGPHRCALCVGGSCIGELERGKRGGVHDVAFGVVGVGSNVPAGGGSVPLHVVARIDLKHVSAATGFGHGGVDGHAVHAAHTGFVLSEEDGVPGLPGVGGGVVGVLLVPHGHGHTVA